MAWRHKNSTNNSQGWEKTIPHPKKAREETPLGEGGVEAFPPPRKQTSQALLSLGSTLREKIFKYSLSLSLKARLPLVLVK
jgi:hypothetical protein